MHPSLSSHQRAHLRLVRYGGMAASSAVALSTALGGVLPQIIPHVNPVTIWRGPHGPVILLGWLVGLLGMAAAWWLGRDRVPTAKWAFVTALLWAVPLLAVPPYGSRDVYSYACQGAVLVAGHDPYVEGPQLLPCQWLESVSTTWWDTPAPYGPVFVLLAAAAVVLGSGLVMVIALLRLAAVLGVLVAAVSLTPLVERLGTSPRRAVWLFLACPLTLLHLIGGIHNDALMIGLALAGLALVAAAQDRLWWLLAGGVLLAFSGAVKATVLVTVPFVLLVALPAKVDLRVLLRRSWPVLAGVLGTTAALTFGTGLGFGWVSALKYGSRSIQWTAPPTAVGQTITGAARLMGSHLDAVPTARVVGMALLALVLPALWLWAWRSGEPWLGMLLALGAVTALSPVFHPWYVLLPLAIAAVTGYDRVWSLLALGATFLVLPDGSNLARFTKFPGAQVMTIAVGVALYRQWLRWRQQVRAAGVPLSPPAADC